MGSGLPGPRGRAATTARWALRPAELLDACQARYGDAFQLDLLRFGPAAFFASPAAAEHLFRADPGTYRADKTKFLRPMLGEHSLLCLNGAGHLAQRRILLRPLHGAHLASYAGVARQIAEREAATWRAGGEFALAAPMRRVALELMLRLVFGVDRAAERDRLGARLAALMRRATSGPAQLIRAAARRDLAAAPGGVLGRLLAAADAELYALIARRRSRGGGDDVLSMLLAVRGDDGRALTDTQVRDQLMTLLLAGHDTTATTLCWAFERALRHPPVWERLRAEARGDGEGDYARAVVAETLRTRPVLWLAGRTLTEEHEIDGRTLPAGSLAYLCSYLLHRRADLHPDPLRFLPERHLRGRPDPYVLASFGGGPRRCIGAALAEMEIREVLLAVAGACDLEAVDPGRDERFRRRGIVMAPDRGARVRRL